MIATIMPNMYYIPCQQFQNLRSMGMGESPFPSGLRLKGIAKPSSGPCVDIDNVCRKCLPRLSPIRNL